MKISYLPLLRTLVLCLFASFSAYSQLVPSQADNAILRYIDPSNPLESNNVDPNWDWTSCCSGNTMYYSTNNSTPIQLNYVQVPFYTGGHQLVEAFNNDAKDMWKEDGWMLAYKDFGTPQVAPPYPFFALYNKYKGIFRVLIYNSTSLLKSHFKVTLSFRSQSPTSALFTFTDKRGGLQALNSYDPGAQQVVITQAPQGQGWIYADFLMAGYVPNLDPNTVLRLSVQAIDQTSLSVTGSMTLDEVTKSSPGGTDAWGDTKKAINEGYKIYKDMAEVQKDVKPNSTTSVFQNVLGFLSSYSDLVGLISYFITGKNHLSARDPLSFKGTTSLSGTLTGEAPILTYDFAMLRGSATSVENYKPVQDIPWGILNLNSSVTVNPVDKGSETYYCSDRGGEVTDINIEYLGNPISYSINPNTNMTLVSVQFHPVHFGNSGIFRDISEISTTTFGYFYDDACFGQPQALDPVGIGIKFEFQINSPTKNYDKNMVFYKIYYFGSNSGRIAANTENPIPLKAYPNPFSDHLTLSFPATQNGTVSVFDAKGVLIKTYSGSDLSSGVIKWDGKSENGNSTPAGIYLLQFSDFPRKPITKRLVKLN